MKLTPIQAKVLGRQSYRWRMAQGNPDKTIKELAGSTYQEARLYNYERGVDMPFQIWFRYFLIGATKSKSAFEAFLGPYSKLEDMRERMTADEMLWFKRFQKFLKELLVDKNPDEIGMLYAIDKFEEQEASRVITVKDVAESEVLING